MQIIWVSASSPLHSLTLSKQPFGLYLQMATWPPMRCGSHFMSCNGQAGGCIGSWAHHCTGMCWCIPIWRFCSLSLTASTANWVCSDASMRQGTHHVQGPSAAAFGLPPVPPMVPMTPANPQAAAVLGVPPLQPTAPPAPAVPSTADILRPAPLASPGAISVSLGLQPSTRFGRCHDRPEHALQSEHWGWQNACCSRSCAWFTGGRFLLWEDA